MKRKLFFLLALMLTSISTWADTDKLPAGDGWTKITELPATLSDYYFVFVDDTRDLMLSYGEGLNQSNEDGRKTMVYRTGKDASMNPAMLWEIVTNTVSGYSIKCAVEPTYYLQTEWEDNKDAPWRMHTHDNGGGAGTNKDWCAYLLNYNESKWTIQTYRVRSESGSYVGPWENGAFKNGQEVAGNKSGTSNIGYFQIYAILKSAVDITGVSTATGSNPFNYTYKITNSYAATSTYGWTLDGDALTRNGNLTGFDEIKGFFESWKNASYTGNFTQSVTGLPAGKYRLRAAAQLTAENTTLKMSLDDAEISCPANGDTGGTILQTGEETTAGSGVGGWKYSTVESKVTDGSADIKFAVATTANGCWTNFDNVELYLVDPCISTVAIALPDGGAMSAGQWYKYVVDADAEYTISATTAGDIIETEDGLQLVSEATGSALVTGSAVNLTAGTYYYKSSSDNTLTISINDPIQPQRDAIIANKGDITSLINGNFTDNANGWSGGSRITGLARSWRSATDTNPFYEAYGNNQAMTYTLHNMPAGTYKVVAAWRSINGGTMTPSIAGTSGTIVTGVGDAAADDGHTEINTNGVEMPYSTLGGFTTNDWGHNWKWITVTGTLAADGDLVLSFTTSGTAGWNAIDDVHLYCTNLGETSYTKSLPTISENTDLSSYVDGSVITCDIIMSNPNAIMYSTGQNYITTAAGSSLNNFMYKKSGMGGLFNADNVVLYDGNDFSLPGNSKGHYFSNARLYRSFTENTWSTLVVPFWPSDSRFTTMYPSELNSGVLNFENATVDTWTTSINDKPMLVKCDESTNYIDGTRRGTANSKQAVSGDMISGEGVTMNGVYESGTVPVSNDDDARYAVVDGELHKVSGTAVVKIKPFRAYFELPVGSGNARDIITFDFDGATAINIIDAADAETEEGLKDGKYLIGGKIVIVKNAVKYSANGQILK